MSKESWYAGKPKDVIRLDESDNFVIDYDKSRRMYRVSIFNDSHFCDEFWFDAYEEKEGNKKIDEIINTLECHRLNFKNYFSNNERKYLGSSGFDYYFKNLINWIKAL